MDGNDDDPDIPIAWQARTLLALLNRLDDFQKQNLIDCFQEAIDLQSAQASRAAAPPGQGQPTSAVA